MRVSVFAFLPFVAAALAALGACSSSEEDDSSDDALSLGEYSEDSAERAAASAEEEFKYGSDGSDTESGIPLTVFGVMPRAFPELLPKDRTGDSWSAFGFIEEPGRDAPVGFSIRRYQLINRVGPNCAVCHTGTYRVSDSAERKVVLGGANTRVDVQAFLRFIARAAEHPQFRERLIRAMDQRAEEMRDKLWIIKRPLVEKLLLPLTQKGFKKNMNVAWMASRPNWGPGRIDPFNPVKFGMLKMEVDDTVGNSDALPIWGVADRPDGAYHWDGLNTSLREVFISSALGDGATLDSVEIERLDRKRAWLKTVIPPPYPFAIDAAKAAQGKAVFDRQCAECHATPGVTWHVVRLETVGTDRNRLDMWSAAAASAYNAFSQGKPWAMYNFQKTVGYVAPGLRGIWLTGPYLHNGSVPSLRALLEPPDARPKAFTRGYDVLDPENVGYVSDARTSGHGFAVDTTVRGNSNAGHNFGTELGATEKDALVEYLKTL
jgi:mono/diheme cytochrome c family protein